MSTFVLALRRRSAWLARAADYLELTKPGISVMILVTVAVAGYLARWGRPDPWALLNCLWGTLLVSASASAVNQWLERDSDSRMPRTADRPLPAGRLTAVQVLTFAAITVVVGGLHLALTVGWTTTMLALATWSVYAWIYTPLKSRTPFNTVIGAVAGALPMLIGWAGVGGGFELRADPRWLALFLTLFFWQFPHFMAIAWIYRRQYGEAGLRMLTVVDPSGRRAGVQAVLAALALLPVSLLPAMLTPGVGGVVYLLLASVLGIGQLICAVLFLRHRDETTARRLLRASLIYLPALLACLLFLPLV